MTTLHTTDIDVAAIVSPSQEQPRRQLVAPAVTTTPCRCCPAVIQHVGALTVPFCDGCLDAMTSSTCPCGAELQGNGAYCSSLCASTRGTHRRRNVDLDVDNDEVSTQPAVEPVEPVDVDDLFTRAPLKLRQEIFTASVTEAEQSSTATPQSAADTDPATICASCSNVTERLCKCGRRCCYDCMDADWLCPSCDGEEA